MTMANATSERITELANKKKLSGYAIIKASGIPAATYRSIMSGRSKSPGIETLYKIMRALGVTPKEFFDSPLFDNVEAKKEKSKLETPKRLHKLS